MFLMTIIIFLVLLDLIINIYLIMAPLVLVGTVITHLFGGSAGREGTAVQMGGSIADQLSRYVKFTEWERKVLIMCGISAGFASVFGTPMAGAIFALEIIFIRKIKYDAIIPVLMSAFIATYVCDLWPITHTHYQISSVPSFNFQNVGLVILASILFGLASVGFSVGMNLLSSVFKKHIKNLVKSLKIYKLNRVNIEKDMLHCSIATNVAEFYA